MSSPNLNNLIIVGCLLCYSSVIILGLDSSLTSEPAFRYICTVKAWVLMAGFTLSRWSPFFRAKPRKQFACKPCWPTPT